jgi:hypothetical protein
MKRIIGLIVTILLSLGFVASASPAEADFVSAATSRAICIYGDPGAGWRVYSYHTLHYGDAHVTQCWYKYVYGGTWCAQYVWNVPDPHWEAFPPRQIGDFTYICW